MTTSPPSPPSPPYDSYVAFLEKHANTLNALPKHKLMKMALLQRKMYSKNAHKWANYRPKHGDYPIFVTSIDKDGNIHKKADRGYYLVENGSVVIFSTIDWVDSTYIRYVCGVRYETPMSERKKTTYGPTCTVEEVDVSDWTTRVVYDGLRR